MSCLKFHVWCQLRILHLNLSWAPNLPTNSSQSESYSFVAYWFLCLLHHPLLSILFHLFLPFWCPFLLTCGWSREKTYYCHICWTSFAQWNFASLSWYHLPKSSKLDWKLFWIPLVLIQGLYCSFLAKVQHSPTTQNRNRFSPSQNFTWLSSSSIVL